MSYYLVHSTYFKAVSTIPALYLTQLAIISQESYDDCIICDAVDLQNV